MTIRAKISETPSALRELLEEKTSYEQLIRQTRWGEGVITLIAGPTFIPAGISAAYAFESLLGWPVIVRSAAEYKAYCASSTHPRSVALVISPSGEEEEAIGAAQAAARCGARVLALTANRASSLAGAVHGVFRLPGGYDEPPFLRNRLLVRAGLTCIAFLTAKIFSPRAPRLSEIEEELERLPDRVEWLQTNFSDAVRSLAAQLQEAAQITILGAGFYYPVAMEAATLASDMTGIAAEARHPSAFGDASAKSRPGEKRLALFLSGSQCKVKKIVHDLAAQMKHGPRRLISITDSNDRSLIDCCEASLLLPPLLEISGALLTQVLLQWLLLESARNTP